jgi:hypothetical protein
MSRWRRRGTTRRPALQRKVAIRLLQKRGDETGELLDQASRRRRTRERVLVRGRVVIVEMAVERRFQRCGVISGLMIVLEGQMQADACREDLRQEQSRDRPDAEDPLHRARHLRHSGMLAEPGSTIAPRRQRLSCHFVREDCD